MDYSNKKILVINLEKKTSEVQALPDLIKYIGGVSLGLKLYSLNLDSDPIIFSVGPLSGLFPFASKTSVVFGHEDLVEDHYLGGCLSSRIRFADLDAIVIKGRSYESTIINIQNDVVSFESSDTDPASLGLPGKRSIMIRTPNGYLLDHYFRPPGDLLDKKLRKNHIEGIVITGETNILLPNVEKYCELYRNLLERGDDLQIEKGFFPSCSGCPMGCEKSNEGEIGGNILVHSLVVCQSAEGIYSDIGTAFSCLNVLGYNYTHEDLENLPLLVQNTLREIKEK